MRGNNEEKASPKESLRQLQKKINTISRRVDAFSSRLEGMSSITSPERKQNYESCDKLKAEIELISKELSCLPKANQDVSLEAFTEQKKKAKLRLDSLKSQLDRISEQLEPDEVEEDYFRKMQAGEVGASTSDILTDKADDDANPGRDTDSGDEEDENDDEQDEDSEEESTANIVMVRKVRTLSDFDGEQDGDLSFKKGEILTVIKTTEDGWWDAENEAGKQGVVPKTLVEIIHEEETPSPRQQPEEEPSAISRETRDKVPEMSRTRRFQCILRV